MYLNFEPMAVPEIIGGNSFEPTRLEFVSSASGRQSGKEFEAAPIGFDIRAPHRNVASLRLFQHQLHINQYVVGVVLDGPSFDFRPKRRRRHSDTWNEVALLHVARRQRPVEVIDERERYVLASHYPFGG